MRSFVREKLPTSIRDKVLGGLELSRADHVLWQRTLHERGWGGVGWPKQFGGPGWNSVQQYIFDEETALAGAPRLIPFGTKMVAPVIMAFGNAAQQQRFLPPISSGAEWWCQGYSEPGAGSDLASLKTRAVLDGDHYIVNGQKTWNTLGQYADWIFCLVRTDSHAKQQSGISFLLIDMKSPGITVRPITLLDGGHEVNEIWFENVKVPVQNRIGDENKGWTYAKFLLGHERTNIAGIGGAKRELQRLKRIAALERKNGRPLIEDPLFAAQHRAGRDRSVGSGNHQPAHVVRGAGLPRAGPGGLDLEDQGNRNRTAYLRAADARGRTIRTAVCGARPWKRDGNPTRLAKPPDRAMLPRSRRRI